MPPSKEGTLGIHFMNNSLRGFANAIERAPEVPENEVVTP